MISSWRRAALLPALAVAGLLALSGCSSADAAGTSGSGSGGAADGAWSFTDDTGRTVDLDSAPERIASYADYALGLMSYDVDPVAVFGRTAVADDERFAGKDLSGTAVVGNTYGEIDLEALAEAAPDLIVTGIYPEDREGTLDLAGPLYGLADVEQQQQLEKIAPIVAIEVGGRGADVIDSVNRLASSLGVSDATIAEAKAGYDAAAADLTAAAAESGLEVTQMYADADGVYVVKPGDEPETQLYGELGVDFTDAHPDGDYYWDVYSWENAAQMMTGDVLLVNVEGLQAVDLAAQPTFASHPALVAGQVHTWNGAALDFASQAAHMTELAEVLRASKDVA